MSVDGAVKKNGGAGVRTESTVMLRIGCDSVTVISRDIVCDIECNGSLSRLVPTIFSQYFGMNFVTRVNK